MHAKCSGKFRVFIIIWKWYTFNIVLFISHVLLHWFYSLYMIYFPLNTHFSQMLMEIPRKTPILHSSKCIKISFLWYGWTGHNKTVFNLKYDANILNCISFAIAQKFDDNTQLAQFGHYYIIYWLSGKVVIDMRSRLSEKNIGNKYCRVWTQVYVFVVQIGTKICAHIFTARLQ